MSYSQDDQNDFKLQILSPPEEILGKRRVYSKSKIFKIQVPEIKSSTVSLSFCRYTPGQKKAEVIRAELKRPGEHQTDKSTIFTLNVKINFFKKNILVGEDKRFGNKWICFKKYKQIYTLLCDCTPET
jgi:hypothetical protein